MSTAFPAALDGRYERLALLGKGGMGTVFRARDRDLGREVAIKVLHLDVDDTVEERFRREAEVLAELHHPNIIEVYDHGVTPDGPYIVMELVDGQDLDAQPDGFEPLDELLPIADALEAVHAHGLVHRDVKPANILRTRDGRCILMDFGLIFVQDRTALTNTGAVSGTVTFMSPETMQLADVPRPPADWWALGVTLYALYERRLPYEMNEVLGFASLRRVPPLRFVALAEASREARAIRALLDPDPVRRPCTRAELEQAAAGQPLVRLAAADAAQARAEARPGRRRLGMAAAAVALGLVAGLLEVGPEAPPTPVHASEAPAPPAPTSAPRFGDEYLARARRELEAAEGLAIREDWQVVRRDAPDAWIGLTDLDPLVWGALWGELEHVLDFHAWLASGGRPEDLDAASIETLGLVEELHTGLLLPAPFSPLLAGPAARPVPVPAGIADTSDDLPPLEGAYDGWLGAALAAHEELQRVEARLQADLDANIAGRPTSEAFPTSQGLATTVWRAQVSGLVGTYFLKPEDRRSLRRWFGDGMPVVRRLLYCLGRALHRDQPHRELAAIMADRLMTRSSLYSSEFAAMDPGLALGVLPQDFATRLARIAFRSIGVEVLHGAGMLVRPPIPEQLAQVVREQRELDLDAPLGRYRYAALTRLRERLTRRAGDDAAVVAMITDARPVFDRLDLKGARRTVAGAGLRLWEDLGHDAPLDRGTKDWIKQVLRDRSELTRLLERLGEAP